MSARLVRHGVDEAIPERYGGNTAQAVYSEMLLQIAVTYPGLPDVRELTTKEIEFFYDGIRGDLQKSTKPKG